MRLSMCSAVKTDLAIVLELSLQPPLFSMARAHSSRRHGHHSKRELTIPIPQTMRKTFLSTSPFQTLLNPKPPSIPRNNPASLLLPPRVIPQASLSCARTPPPSELTILVTHTRNLQTWRHGLDLRQAKHPRPTTRPRIAR